MFAWLVVVMNICFVLTAELFNTAVEKLANEVCKIINHCEQIATEIILNNRVVIDLVVEKLLDVETIDGEAEVIDGAITPENDTETPAAETESDDVE